MNTYKVLFSTNNGASWTMTNLNSHKITTFTYDGSYIYAASKSLQVHSLPPIYRSSLGSSSWTLISIVDSIGDRHYVCSLAKLGSYIFAGMGTFQGFIAKQRLSFFK